MGTAVRTHSPLSFDVAVRVFPRSAETAVISAFGTTAPAGSVTVPYRLPVSWAGSRAGRSSVAIARMRFMDEPQWSFRYEWSAYRGGRKSKRLANDRRIRRRAPDPRRRARECRSRPARVRGYKRISWPPGWGRSPEDRRGRAW